MRFSLVSLAVHCARMDQGTRTEGPARAAVTDANRVITRGYCVTCKKDYGRPRDLNRHKKSETHKQKQQDVDRIAHAARMRDFGDAVQSQQDHDPYYNDPRDYGPQHDGIRTTR